MLRFSFLTRVYDKVIATSLKEASFRGRLVRDASLKPGMRILDIGCGTGSFLILANKAVAALEAIGIDGDPQVLDIARKKSLAAGVGPQYVNGLSFDTRLASESFDRIFSTLMFHHLTLENKRKTASECYRLMKPGGELHICDWGQPHDFVMRAMYLGIQLLDGFETTRDNAITGLVPFLQEAGFDDAKETHRERTIFGTLSMYKARRPR